MRPLLALTALSILAASCSVPTPMTARQAPKNAAELVREYQAQTGFDITYDEQTARVLESITVMPVNPRELNVIRLDARPVAAAREATAPVFEVIVLKYSEASPLAATLTDLVRSAAVGGEAEPEIKILTDPRTNSLLVTAPAEHMERIKTLVATLDTEVRSGG